VWHQGLQRDREWLTWKMIKKNPLTSYFLWDYRYNERPDSQQIFWDWPPGISVIAHCRLYAQFISVFPENALDVLLKNYGQCFNMVRLKNELSYV
jgi:hypothetical protein